MNLYITTTTIYQSQPYLQSPWFESFCISLFAIARNEGGVGNRVISNAKSTEEAKDDVGGDSLSSRIMTIRKFTVV